MAIVLGVNSYATEAEADLYFEDRIDAAQWAAASTVNQEQALVTATALLEQLNYAGFATTGNQALAFPRRGNYFDTSRGRDFAFDGDYTFVELNTGSSEAFWNALVALDRDIQLLKKACFEQALHLLSNEDALDTTGATSSTSSAITVGSISISGGTASSSGGAVPNYSDVAIAFARPLMAPGGQTWFRAN